jgi:hypothetical protein
MPLTCRVACGPLSLLLASVGGLSGASASPSSSFPTGVLAAPHTREEFQLGVGLTSLLDRHRLLSRHLPTHSAAATLPNTLVHAIQSLAIFGLFLADFGVLPTRVLVMV